jgi:para-aminobenzoate synthetase
VHVHTLLVDNYHSLCVENPVPAELIPTAWAEDGVIMALRHRDLPRWGVQFHPESIASRYGRELLANFRDLSAEVKAKSEGVPVTVAGGALGADRTAQTPPPMSLRLAVARVPKAVNSEVVFLEFFESSLTCFWLDSSRVEAGLSRFSFLGDASGPLSEVLSYRISTGVVKVEDAGGVRVESGSIFDVLNRRLRDRQLVDPELPFDLSGGYVGYFGYELKADCGAENQHTADTPDAMWIFADRLIAVDHQTGLTYVLAVYNGAEQREPAEEWTKRTATRLLDLDPAYPLDPAGSDAATIGPADHFVVGQQCYQADIEESQRQLVRGESYEICLTNKLRIPYPRRRHRILPPPAPGESSTVLRTAAGRRCDHLQLVAGAVPAD